jgi:hypothetical protein
MAISCDSLLPYRRHTNIHNNGGASYEHQREVVMDIFDYWNIALLVFVFIWGFLCGIHARGKVN